MTDGRNSQQVLSDLDLHLLAEGTHLRAFDRLGAHLAVRDGVRGTTFAVWAPNARGVSVIGDFNGWDPSVAPLRLRTEAGIWEGFIAGVGQGALYKFSVEHEGGHRVQKSDPYAFAAETRPRTASKVWDLEGYAWRDAAWMRARGERQRLDAPMSVYELHLGSWRRNADGGWLTYTELATELTEYVTRLGFTHVELMPVMEHPLDGSWGYQVTGYFAPTSRFGTPQEFMALVDALHRADIGVILDWVPGHFPTDAHGLAQFDGTWLYEHADSRLREHPEWGTYTFNHGRREVQNFLIANALFWLERYHIDGLRVDAVASMLYRDYGREAGQWLPNEHGGREDLGAITFIRRLNEEVYRAFPDAVTIAEESTAWPMVSRPTYLGGLGFGLKWNMGWMHDTLDYMSRDPIYRSFHHHEMTFSMLYAYSENYVLPISHDEVVHGKGTLWGRMPGNDHVKAAGLRSLLAYQWAHPGKKLLFMGQEFGQRAEWSEERGIDWYQLDENSFSSGISRFMADVNAVYRRHPALWSQDSRPEGYSWIDANDSASNVLSFLRYGSDGSVLACVFNFAGSEHTRYRLGLPRTGTWREVLNSDATIYNGSGIGNFGFVEAAERPWHGRPASAELVLPPTSAVWLEPC